MGQRGDEGSGHSIGRAISTNLTSSAGWEEAIEPACCLVADGGAAGVGVGGIARGKILCGCERCAPSNAKNARGHERLEYTSGRGVSSGFLGSIPAKTGLPNSPLVFSRVFKLDGDYTQKNTLKPVCQTRPNGVVRTAGPSPPKVHWSV
jgi:hypothetical protein